MAHGSQQVDAVQQDPLHPDPFEGNSIRIQVDKPIDVNALQDEISRRCRTKAMVVLSVMDIEKDPTPAQPALLFVSPGNINERVVREVIAQHVAPAEVRQPDAPGVPPAPSSTFDPALLPDDIQPLVEKLREGETLKTAETSDLLRAVFGIGG